MQCERNVAKHCGMLQCFENYCLLPTIILNLSLMKQIKHLTYSFEYLLAQAQDGFQQNITGLLEVQQHIAERIKKAKDSHWKSVHFSIVESELTSGYLLRTIGELMGRYDSINKCLIQINKQQRITDAIIEIQARALLKKSTDTQSEKKA